MDHPYRITIFDNFHRFEPDGAWPGGTFATLDAATTVTKRRIDADLVYFWSEVRDIDNGRLPLDRLVSQYNSFAEMPIVFDRDGHVAFDSAAYMKSKAAEIVSEAAALKTRRD